MRISAQALIDPRPTLIEAQYAPDADYEFLALEDSVQENDEPAIEETKLGAAVEKALEPLKEEAANEERARAIFDQIGGSVKELCIEYMHVMKNSASNDLRFKALQDVAKIQKILVPPDKTPSNSVQITVMSDIVNVGAVLNPRR